MPNELRKSEELDSYIDELITSMLFRPSMYAYELESFETQFLNLVNIRCYLHNVLNRHDYIRNLITNHFPKKSPHSIALLSFALKLDQVENRKEALDKLCVSLNQVYSEICLKIK